MYNTQENMILEYLKAGNSLTPLTALNLFQTMRLGARCFDLKQKGYNIKSEIIKDNRTGKHYSRYSLETITDKTGQQRLV